MRSGCRRPGLRSPCGWETQPCSSNREPTCGPRRPVPKTGSIGSNWRGRDPETVSRSPPSRRSNVDYSHFARQWKRLRRGRAPGLASVVSARRYLLHLATAAVLYFLAGKLGLALASVNESASPFWVPSGIAIAATLLFGLRIWPAIALAAFFVNVTTTGSMATSAGIAIGNTLEAAIAAELLNRFAGGSAAFERPQGVVRFAALMVPAAAISASVGLFSLRAGGLAEHSQTLAVWLTWWLGDLGGALIFTPLIVLWSRKHGTQPVPGKPLEAVALALI